MTYGVAVSGQSCIKYDRNCKLAADSIDFVEVVFQLPSEWANLQCVAQFAQNDRCYNKALVDGKCKLPNEMQAGEFSVSVFGYEAGQAVRGTTSPLVDIIEESGFHSDGATPVPPTPDLYAQLLEKINQTEATIGEYADAAKQSAAAAKASEDEAAKSATDADRTANSIKDSMTQISENKEAVNQLEGDVKRAKNAQFAFGIVEKKYIIISDGSEASDNSWNASEFIYVGSNVSRLKITTTSGCNNNAWYKADKTFHSTLRLTTGENYKDVPPGANYFRLSNSAERLDETLIEALPDVNLREDGMPADALAVSESIAMAMHGFYHFSGYQDQYIQYQDGVMASSKNWTASTFIDVSCDAEIVMIMPASTMYNAWYADDKSFLQRLSVNEGINVVKVPDGAHYLRFSTETNNFGDILVKTKNSGEYDIPKYYDAHLESKIATIKSYDDVCGSNGDQFIFVTDYHLENNTAHSPYLCREILGKTSASHVVFGGDAINGTDTQDECKEQLMSFVNLWNTATENRFYPIIGNHEYYSNWQNPGDYKGGISQSAVYANFCKFAESRMGGYDGAVSYFVDNKAQKIRYIMCGCDYYGRITETQNHWIMETLVDTPNNYDVVIIAHWALDVDNTTGASSITDRYVYIASACDAFNEKTNYVYGGKTYDYSGKSGCVICTLSGHFHADGDVRTSGGMPIIATTCDAWRNEYSSLSRTKGTVSEQAFDVVSIDKTNRKIYLTRIGAGTDRVFDY